MTLRVAVIDDCHDTADSIGALLNIKGHLTLCLYTAEQLVPQLLHFGPDLLIMDAAMPGVSGLEAIRLIRAEPRLSSLPSVCVSGRSRPQDKTEALHAGFDVYFLKPDVLDSLARLIDSFDEASGLLTKRPD